MTSSEEAALDLVEDLRERLADVEESVERRRAAGHAPPGSSRWTGSTRCSRRAAGSPSRSAAPGAGTCWAVTGEDATPTSWEAVQDLDPEMLLVMPRATDLAGTLAAWAGVSRPAGWGEMHAVRRGQVFALDAAAYFGNAGPGVIDGIELLAELFDPRRLRRRRAARRLGAGRCERGG